jgi:hypothetical protein
MDEGQSTHLNYAITADRKAPATGSGGESGNEPACRAVIFQRLIDEIAADEELGPGRRNLQRASRKRYLTTLSR